MAWIQQKPASICSLNEALPLFLTGACRTLGAGYLELLEQTNGAIPLKSQFDVARFVKAIPHLALCAIKKPDRCIYRVAGEGLKERIGFNPTGQNYYDFVPEERRTHAAQAMHMAIDVPCGFRSVIEQQYSNGLAVTVETVGFPLITEESEVDGYLIFADQGVAVPTQLALSSSRLLGANVMRRDLIDLGFGVDENFVDLVRDN
jgi:hypothetical protein